MATTYVKLDSYTVGAGTSASITFSNINQSYTDIMIRVSSRSTAADNWMTISFNGGITTPITSYMLSGNGSTVTSTARTDNFVLPNGNSSYTSGDFSNGEIYIPSYSNSLFQKFMTADGVNENNTSTALSNMGAPWWNNHSPITSVTLTPNSGSFAQYSTFVLYGIFKYDVSAVPTAPTIGSPTAGAGIASIAFTGTANAGSYTATSSPGGLTGTAFASPVVVNGLTNGTAYTFTVKGNNGYGASTASSATSSVTPQNYAGYWAGGDPSTTDQGGVSYISQLAYNNEVVINTNQYLSASCVYVQAFANSNVAAYFAGGEARNSIAGATLLLANTDKLTFATTTKSTTTAMPAARGSGLANANSGTAGYVAGGSGSPILSSIVKLAFSAETWTTLSATLPTAIYRGGSCANSGTAGYTFGGNGSSGSITTIQKLLYSNDTTSTLSATLTYQLYTNTAVSNNGTAGYCLGGYNGNMLTQIDKLTYSSDTKTGISAKLASSFVSADAGAHSYSGNAGYVGAGYDATGFVVVPSGSATGSKAQINKLTYSGETVSVLSAVMIQPSLLDSNGCANSGIL